MLKIKGTEIQQGLTELAFDAMDPTASDEFSVRAAQALPVDAQDDDLCRLERDSAQHHFQDDAGPMNFDYNEEQQLLADSLRRYLQAQYSFEQRKKALDGSAEVWAKFAEMGLMRCRSRRPRRLRRRRGRPDGDHGGVRRGLGGRALSRHGDGKPPGCARGSAAQKSAILPAVAEGQLKMRFAHTEKRRPLRPGGREVHGEEGGRPLADRGREEGSAGCAGCGQGRGLCAHARGCGAVSSPIPSRGQRGARSMASRRQTSSSPARKPRRCPAAWRRSRKRSTSPPRSSAPRRSGR